MQRVAQWARQHDSAKLALVALAFLLVMPLLIASGNSQNTAIVGLILGLCLCGVAGYWVGNWKWIVIPLLAMLAEIVYAIPLTMQDPGGIESPVSVVLEAPFWTGLPALIGAGAGYLIRRGIG